MDRTHIHTYIIFVLIAHVGSFFFFLVLLKINKGLSMDSKDQINKDFFVVTRRQYGS